MASGRVGGALAKVKRTKDDDNNNKEHALFSFEGSKLPLTDLIKEWNKRILNRSTIFDKNSNVQHKEFEKLIKEKKLDSNLKKCSAFVRKMRHFSDFSMTGLESDIRTFNLTKYISEIALVIVEIRVKPGEMASLISVCSEIHSRYQAFSDQLMENFRTAFEIDDLTSTVKLSSDLGLFTALLLAGILPMEIGSNLLVKTLHHWTALDGSCSHLISTLIHFLRDCTEELIGGLPRDVRIALENHACVAQLERIPNSGLQICHKTKVKVTLKKYFHSAKSQFVKENDKVLGSAKRLRKLLDTKGEIPPDQEKAHRERALQLVKYHSQLEKLANLLDISTPKIRQLSINPDDDLDDPQLLAADNGEGIGEDNSLFEDEETRQFYQDLPDLQAYLIKKKGLVKSSSGSSVGKSGATLQRTKSSSEVELVRRKNEEPSDVDNAGSSSSSDFSEDDSDSDSESDDSFDSEAEKQELMQGTEQPPSDMGDDTLPSSRYESDDVGCDDLSQDDTPTCSGHPKISFSAYLQNLKNCVSIKMIDQAAYDFVDNFKSRKCKQEFARLLFSLPRKRMDLLRLFSRLISSVSQVYPDIGQTICELLRKDFRFLVLKRDHYRLDSKLKITRFIGELTMFSVFPKSEAFNCFKMLLRNFTHQQIEMTCCFLETCGRFLYKSRDSHRRMNLYLEEMLRRKTTQFLEPRYAHQIDSVYYLLHPTSGGSIPKKVKTPLHAFMEYILIYDLKRDTLERANKALRMFDWKDNAKSDMAIGVLSSPWRLNYAQLDTAAALLASVKQFHPNMIQAVIENISEVVRLGCEFESEDINSMRMSTCQYIAHLYNYKCLSTASLLNVMYYLISYGVSYQDNVFSRVDPPDSLYRVRVICHMLRIVGSFVSTPKSNRRLDFFLTYFQRYYLYKRGLSVWEETAGRKRFPHYVEEMFEDTMRKVREKWNFVKTMEEAEDNILELDKKLRQKVKNREVKRAISGERAVIGVKIPVDVKKEAVMTKPVNYDEATVARGKDLCCTETTGIPELEPVQEEEEDDFEKELLSMCSEEAGCSREKYGNALRKPIDVPAAKVMASRRSGSGIEALNYGMPKVKVTVLTKQNNKPREKTVEVETVEDFLVNIKQREEQEVKEKQEVKTRTLALSRRQQEEEQSENNRSMMDALRKLGNVTTLPSASSKRIYQQHKNKLNN